MFTHSLFPANRTGSLWRKFSVLCLCLAALAVAGCDANSEPQRFGPKAAGAELSGSWTSTGGDNFTIDKDANTFSYWYGTGSPNYGTGSMDYAGEILTAKSLLTSRWGYLTIKVTAAGEYGPDTGKYYVIHWKNLEPAKVEESNSYREGGNNNGMKSAAEAEAEYTTENGYFGSYGTYTK